MFEKLFSYMCCCFSTLTSAATSRPSSSPPSSSSSCKKRKTEKKRRAHTVLFVSPPASSECRVPPAIIPRAPAKSDSLPYPFIDDSIDDSSALITDTSSDRSGGNSSRISAIRELIETEQRYVNDLRTVANDFIKPLSTKRILSDYEVDQLFSNWFSLIACNTVFLSTLQEQVQDKVDMSTSHIDVSVRTPLSASLSNIATIAEAPDRWRLEPRPRSITRYPPKRARSSEHLDDNIVPQSFRSYSTMTITDLTSVGDVLCTYLPFMADAYFQYCSCRSQANKCLQSKSDLSDEFRSSLEAFQDKTGGLSLNGFLTKPIQRVTRYPLLIEKILKHTPLKHPDYRSIQKAFDCARQLNERINQQISDQENSSRLDWLQHHLGYGSDDHCSDRFIFDELLKFNSKTRFHTQRQLLLHGSIAKAPSGKELLVFLFDDFLLLSTIKTSASHWQSLLFEPKSNLHLKLYRSPLILADIILASELPNDPFTFVMTTKTREKPFMFKTPQTNIRTLWVRAINHAVDEYHAKEKSILAENALFAITDNDGHSKSAVARLLLVVQEAHDLTPSTATNERHRSLDPYCEITVGALTLKTPFVKRTHHPKWNVLMTFFLHNLEEDVIHINIFDNEFFSPNENLGHTSVQLLDILPCPLKTYLVEPALPFPQTLYLNNGSSITMKCLLQLL